MKSEIWRLVIPMEQPQEMLFADAGPAFLTNVYPSSPWPRTEEDIQRQEMSEAWAEVNRIAPGVNPSWEPAIWPVGIEN